AKVGAIVEALSNSGPTADLVTVVTSDHGEHFGEHRLLDHQFSLRNVLLHVPLVVHGVPGAKAAVIDEPVSLIDVAPSVLAWAGLDPSDLPGRVLPAEAPAAPLPPRDLFAAYSDGKPGDWPGEIRMFAADSSRKRAQCGPSDRVFGDIASLTRFPHKLIWYRDHPAQLYDLRWDAAERTDQAATLPETAARLEAEITEHLERTGFFRDSAGSAPALSPEAREALEGLGYVE
ncbi:MAG: sulfatase-like hydrolase/transferase, partial [Myxococcota bacterium]